MNSKAAGRPCSWPRLPLEQWPALDREAWKLAHAPSDSFEGIVGYACRWRPTTLRAIEEDYGRWLGWLAAQQLLDPQSDPAVRVTRDLASRYLAAMESAGLADYTRSNRVQRVGEALRAIRPNGDWSWILTGAARVRRVAKPAKDISARLRSPEEVLQLGRDLMAEAEDGRFRSSYDRATLFRDGLLLALQVYRALRPKNLTSITIGQQLKRSGEGWRVEFTPAEMKAKRPHSCTWPTELVPALERYIDHYRPLLMNGGFSGRKAINELWVSKGGAPMRNTVLAYRITLRTEEQFGLAINPQAFRHMAATLIATDNPEGATGIAGVLAHASLETSEKFYNKAKSIDASRRYQVTLAEIGKLAGLPKRGGDLLSPQV